MEGFYLIHDSQNSKFRRPFGAVKAASKVFLNLEAQHFHQVFLELLYFDGHRESILLEGNKISEGRYSYSKEIEIKEIGILNYFFKINHDNQLFYYGNNQEGLGGEGQLYWCDPKPYQITVYKDFKVPQWYKEGIIYQIFVDRFYNGNENSKVDNPKKNSFLYGNWEDDPFYIRDKDGKVVRWDFYGGNLEGIIKKLDYIKELGVTCIYLNPIFEAVSSHKYDAGDYKKIDGMFGDENKFKELCNKSEALGIKIVLDGVFSHTGSDSIYFNREGSYDGLGAYQSKESPYYNWYDFQEYPDKYDCWWGFDNQPNVKELEESYVNYIIKDEDSVIAKWMKAGASGWRLDVADELPDEFIKMLKSRMKEVKEDSVLIGEVWEDASNKISYEKRRAYLFGEELDSITNYPFRNMVIDFITGEIGASKFRKVFMSLKENYPEEAFYANMNLLGTHDTERILTMFEGFGIHSKAVVKTAVAIQMCLPGVPLIYYGDEAGLKGGKDPENRRTYPWGKEDREILNWYKKITDLRRNLTPLKKGDISFIDIKEDLLSFKRTYDNKEVVVIVNGSSENRHIELKLTYGKYEDLLENTTIDNENTSTLELLPYEVKILINLG